MPLDSPKGRVILVLLRICLLTVGGSCGANEGSSHAEPEPSSKEGFSLTRPKHIFNKNLLYLSTILYQDSQHWTIWLNDAMITPNQKPDRLVGVFESHIVLNLEGKEYILSPHQTLDPLLGKIYNGDHRDYKESDFLCSEGEDFDF